MSKDIVETPEADVSVNLFGTSYERSAYGREAAYLIVGQCTDVRTESRAVHVESLGILAARLPSLLPTDTPTPLPSDPLLFSKRNCFRMATWPAAGVCGAALLVIKMN